MTQAIAYRGEGYTLQPGCTPQAHYAQLQAMCDALGYAAQSLMSEQFECATEHEAGGRCHFDKCPFRGRNPKRASSHFVAGQYWYGVFQGYRGLLRALEGNIGELEPLEQEMLTRINWSSDPPHFSVPGFEHVRLEDQHLPGEGPPTT